MDVSSCASPTPFHPLSGFHSVASFSKDILVQTLGHLPRPICSSHVCRQAHRVVSGREAGEILPASERIFLKCRSEYGLPTQNLPWASMLREQNSDPRLHLQPSLLKLCSSELPSCSALALTVSFEEVTSLFSSAFVNSCSSSSGPLDGKDVTSFSKTCQTTTLLSVVRAQGRPQLHAFLFPSVSGSRLERRPASPSPSHAPLRIRMPELHNPALRAKAIRQSHSVWVSLEGTGQAFFCDISEG